MTSVLPNPVVTSLSTSYATLTTFHTTVPIFLKLFSWLLWYLILLLLRHWPLLNLFIRSFILSCSPSTNIYSAYYLLSPMPGPRQSQNKALPRGVYILGQLSFIDSPLLLNLQILVVCVCVCVCISCSVVSDSLWPLDYSLPPGSLSMGFPRQEYWSRLPFPSPGDLPDPGIEPQSPAL